MEKRKYEFLLQKAKLTREELDKRFERIDKRIEFIKPGDLIFKRCDGLGSFKEIKPFAQYEVTSIIDKQLGIIEVSNKEGEIDTGCILDFYIEREYLKQITYIPEINKEIKFFYYEKEPVSLFLSDILGFDFFNENDIQNVKLRMLPNYKEKEFYVDVQVDSKFKDIVSSTVNDIFKNMKLNVIDGILKRAQNLSHVVIAYLFGIRCDNNESIWNFKFNFVNDIQVPELCLNYSYNVWLSINDFLLQHSYNEYHHETMHYILNVLVLDHGQTKRTYSYALKPENEILLHKCLLKAIKNFGYNKSIALYNLEKFVIPACENGQFRTLEGFI